jgi:hypothetical protein
MDRVALSGTYTDYLTVEPAQREFPLRAWPVTAVTDANFDMDQAWTGSALAATDYFSPIFSTTGSLIMKYDLVPAASPRDATSALRVRYTGGMAATTAAFIAAFPDVAEAVDLQVAFLWHQRNTIGASSVSGDGGSANAGSDTWVPRALELLRARRRRG